MGKIYARNSPVLDFKVTVRVGVFLYISTEGGGGGGG